MYCWGVSLRGLTDFFFLCVCALINPTMSDSDYSEVLSAVENGEESAKTDLAWYMLCGLGDASKNVDGAVVLLEDFALP